MKYTKSEKRIFLASLENYYDDALTHFFLYFNQWNQEDALDVYCESQPGVSGAAFLDGEGQVVMQYGSDYPEYYHLALAVYKERSGQSEEPADARAVLVPPVLVGERHFAQFMVTAVEGGAGYGSIWNYHYGYRA